MRKRGPDRKKPQQSAERRAFLDRKREAARLKRTVCADCVNLSAACRAASPAARGSRKPPRFSALRSRHGSGPARPRAGLCTVRARARAGEKNHFNDRHDRTARPFRTPRARVSVKPIRCRRTLRLQCVVSAASLPPQRCRRTRRCGGDPQRCLATRQAAVPPDARRYIEATLAAARYNRVRAGSGTQWLRENYSCEAEAFNAWAARFETRGWGRPPHTRKAAPSRWRPAWVAATIMMALGDLHLHVASGEPRPLQAAADGGRLCGLTSPAGSSPGWRRATPGSAGSYGLPHSAASPRCARSAAPIRVR
jgi:hypothetical protein